MKRKDYKKPSVEWISFQVTEELAGPSMDGGTVVSPFSVDEGYTSASANGDYTAE